MKELSQALNQVVQEMTGIPLGDPDTASKIAEPFIRKNLRPKVAMHREPWPFVLVTGRNHGHGED